MENISSILNTRLLSHIICLFLLYGCQLNERIRILGEGILQTKAAIFFLTGKLLT
jgi:hypothetical protein